jgi:hypothetical protein
MMFADEDLTCDAEVSEFLCFNEAVNSDLATPQNACRFAFRVESFIQCFSFYHSRPPMKSKATTRMFPIVADELSGVESIENFF